MRHGETEYPQHLYSGRHTDLCPIIARYHRPTRVRIVFDFKVLDLVVIDFGKTQPAEREPSYVEILYQ